jgi:hypothetical protein
VYAAALPGTTNRELSGKSIVEIEITDPFAIQSLPPGLESQKRVLLNCGWSGLSASPVSFSGGPHASASVSDRSFDIESLPLASIHCVMQDVDVGAEARSLSVVCFDSSALKPCNLPSRPIAFLDLPLPFAMKASLRDWQYRSHVFAPSRPDILRVLKGTEIHMGSSGS